MFKMLRRYAARQMFHPGILGVLINPFYHSRKALLHEIRNLAPQLSGKLLDVGCGFKPYLNLFSYSEYVGLEIDNAQSRSSKPADKFYDGHTFPFANGEFEGVVSFQVLEHVEDADRFLREIARVTRDEGLLLLSVPFIWDEHEQPNDYRRYSTFGITQLLERHEFQVVDLRRTLPDLRVIAQLVNAYLYKRTVTSNPYVNAATTALLMSPVTIAGSLARVFPKNPDLYLDNVVLARRQKRESCA